MIRHTFGPVPSRRLGISLGVDVTPFKTCSLDCVYCECGKTTHLDLERRKFVEPKVVLEELREKLQADLPIEYITFSGSGEPTLYSELGALIDGIKSISAIPVAVLTNGTLLYREDVRRDLQGAALVLPSLDAVSPEIFAQINKPHPDLDIKRIIEGLIAFRSEFSGRIWLEVFIAEGINDHREELDRIHDTILRIRPDRVQLNSLDRPPAYPGISTAAMEKLEAIVDLWNDLPVEIIKRFKSRGEIRAFNSNLENNILNTIIRRPLAIDDLESLTGKPRLELYKYIDILEREKKIHAQIISGKIFYVSAPASEPRDKS